MATALDANVLLRFFQKMHPLHKVTRAAVRHLREADEDIHILPQNVVEFWSDTPNIHTEWRCLVADHDVSGVQVYDARIAACLHVHGVTRLLTFNAKDFARYSGSVAVDPGQI